MLATVGPGRLERVVALSQELFDAQKFAKRKSRIDELEALCAEVRAPYAQYIICCRRTAPTDTESPNIIAVVDAYVSYRSSGSASESWRYRESSSLRKSLRSGKSPIDE